MNPFRRNLAVVCAIMLVTLGVGYFRAWDAGDGSYLMMWFWIGVAITVVYLLYRITSNLEKLRIQA